MEVTYRKGFWDMVWFNFYQIPRTPTAQIGFGIFALVLGYSIFSTFNDIVDPTIPLWISILSCIVLYFLQLAGISLVIMAIMFLAPSFVYITSQSQRQQTKQDCKLSVSENGLISESAIGRSEIKWSGIVKMRQSRNYILFYFSERTALLVPKRAFVNSVDADKFFTYSYQIWERAKNIAASQTAA